MPGRKTGPDHRGGHGGGPIVSGRGGPQALPLSRSSAGGDAIAAALRKAASGRRRQSGGAAGDSPGGAVTGSETIWREVPHPRGRHPGGRLDGCGRRFRRLLRRHGRGHHRGQPRHDHRVDRGGHRKAGGPRTQGPPRRRPDTVHNTNADAGRPTRVHRRAARHGRGRGRSVLRRLVNRSPRLAGIHRGGRRSGARPWWTGADARERGLVDELGGLRTAVRRAKVLAGLDPDTEVSLVSYPPPWRDYLRHRASTAPAASLSDAAASLIVSSVAG